MDRFKLASPWRLLVATLTIGLAGAALFAALRGLEWHAFQAQVKLLDWRWLALAVLFDIASYTAQGLRWRFLLNGANVWQTTRAVYAGLFLNEIVPLRPGEAVRAWLAARDLRVSVLTVAPTMLAERLMDGVWLSGALLVTLIVAPLPASLTRVAWSVIGLVVAIVACALVLGRGRFAMLQQIRSSLFHAPAFAASGLFLFTQGMAFWSVTRASHLALGVAAAFVVMLVVRVGTMIPGAPANLGTHQFSTVLGLSLYGVPHAAAAGFSLVVFVVLTAPLLVIGFAACLNAGMTWRSLEVAGRPAEPAESPLLG